MAEADRQRWDERYATKAPPTVDAVGPPEFLAPHAELLPTAGRALDLACGPGLTAVWLAMRGLRVEGLDVSPVAVAQARGLARRAGVSDRCHFEVVDLDDGLPGGPSADVIVCHRFRDRRLDRAMIERLAPGGLLAIAVLSEVGAAPGPFRAVAGELPAAFAELDLVAADEGEGVAWLLARARHEGL
ncbi:SAM-dependent methyltransferase [Mycobacterium nebraskense]|uniref:SAM-dependent methyltransferase n=2 Tax=Mycobacterium nebraskense TaxID=244292 RepID=A0A1X1ZUC9_9MYCO|nr:class I SAM-dependent methyltransferase [Mycobacterium nebraskense]KLO41024.1 SAM-dependent methyltransferase [Mycobacterium nebraskense]MBI2696796.1 class I SAM-dependent methyltransferase [Mycobacterium nebraskense]MCV7118384.1 class I SAM-dependent methyltransferase [Mycobacterium nebraskense]ORW27633.1 SAM-dependent methyltransferase [Mycobacterium nebraskense]